MSYDVSVWNLCYDFCQDNEPPITDEKVIAELAELVQQTIEDWLTYDDHVHTESTSE